MAKVKVGERVFEIAPLQNSGDEAMIGLLVSLDKMLRPLDYAIYAANRAGADWPKDEAGRQAVIQTHWPDEGNWPPDVQAELLRTITRTALKRAGSPVPEGEPTPGSVAVVPQIVDALWGRLGGDLGKEPSPV